MLKAVIFLDLENLSRNGGRGYRHRVIRRMVEAQRAMILRAIADVANGVSSVDAWIGRTLWTPVPAKGRAIQLA